MQTAFLKMRLGKSSAEEGKEDAAGQSPASQTRPPLPERPETDSVGREKSQDQEQPATGF